MRKRRFIQGLLILALLCGAVLLAHPEAAWAEMSGDGSKEKPYQISTSADLQEFAGKVNGGDVDACAVLTADITINENVLDENGALNGESNAYTQWTPMGGGFDGPGFTGTFDGAGFSIRGVVIDSTDSYVGLFSKIGENGVVKDLILADSFISWGDSNIGAFCGMNEGTITGCVNSSSVAGYSLQIGGICGLNEGIISECVNEGVIRSTGSFSLGGICGGNNNGTVAYCINNGAVVNTGSHIENTGGICGYQFMGSSSTSIENCRNSAPVSATFEAAAVGGICGWNENSIAHCSNDGLVSGEDNAFVGGLCGNNSYKLTDSYWLDTTCEGGVGNATEWSDERSIDAKTSAQYVSGEVAWLLNQGQEAPAWGQASAMPDLLAFEGSLSVPVRVRLVHHAQITTWYLEKGSMLPADERPSLADGEVVVDGNNTVIDPTSYVFEDDTTLSVLSGTLPFSDVSEGDWFYGSVGFAYSQGLMTGTSATTFEPNTSLSRAMLVAVLHRLEGSPQASGSDFTDVADGDWYAEAVNWAASVGVVSGFDDGTFQPNTAITREQMAAILRNYAEYKGMDVTAADDLANYSDAASVSEWAKDSVTWAVDQGLISGITIDTLQPQGLSTRAQVAAVLQRYLAN